MARRQKKYDDIHTYIDRVEDVLLSESSWSTSDSDCSGCPHMNRPNINEDLDSDHQFHSIEKRSKKKIKNRSVFSSAFDKCKNFRKNNAAKEEGESFNDGIITETHENLEIHFHEKGMLQQLALLTAGAQPWNFSISTVYQNKFAYAATLVIYVYQIEPTESNWQLHSILAEHRKTISCIDWHPTNEDYLASCSVDHSIIIWSVSRQCAFQAINICKLPALVYWCPGYKSLLSFSTDLGPVQIWNIESDQEPAPFRNDYNYHPGIKVYAWHPNIPDMLVVGHDDGRITVFGNGVTKTKYASIPDGLDDGENCPSDIINIKWDYHSPDYFLVAYRERMLWLVDVETFKIITKFSLPGSSCVATFAWLHNAPGMFVTGDFERGVLRVWTVSRMTPLENISLKDTGFHVLSVLPCSSPQNDTKRNNSRTSVPNVHILCLFMDGGIGVYHLRRKQWIFNREHGHTETIFDCSFKPEDSDLLATGSFDGSIKIWRVDTMQTVDTLPNCASIIYSISWAPADLNCIVAGTSKGEVFIWDIGKHKVVQDTKLHKRTKVFCVAWNRKDARRIASAGECGSCFVTGINGILLHEYKHPAAVYGCDWRDADILATGCADGFVRLFNISKSSEEAILELKAHNQKVFRVKWNPVFDDIFCSGSDDALIKIWSFSSGECLAELSGHSDNIRGLAWCPELPNLLISGSWDQTLRVWDAKGCTCLDTAYDHRADVYGLSIHPLRPFLLASCSRDSTVRLWSLSKIGAHLQTMVLAGKPVQDIVAEKGAGDFQSKLILSGLRSEFIISSLAKTEESRRPARTFKMFADLFCADVHIRNLWDLVHVLQGNEDISSLSVQYPTSIVHHSHLIKCTMANASEIEIGMGKAKGIRTNYAATECQDKLARMYLSCGALQQYCDLMSALGKWDHAMALAPAVSNDYWKQLLERRSRDLLSEDNQDCVSYLLAAKDADKLIQFYITRGYLDSAFSTCTALDKGRNKCRMTLGGGPPAVPPRQNRKELAEGPLSKRMLECAAKIAELHLKKGSPIEAACALLSVDNIEGALQMLLRSHELELVVAVGRVLVESTPAEAVDRVEAIIDTALCYLAERFASNNSLELALDLAETLFSKERCFLLKAKLYLSTQNGFIEKEKMDEIISHFERAEMSNLTGEIIKKMMSPDALEGFSEAVGYLKECLVAADINSKETWIVLELAHSFVIANKDQIAEKEKFTFGVIACYYGVVKATYAKYHSIVFPLLGHCKKLVEKHDLTELDCILSLIEKSKLRFAKGDFSLGFELSVVAEDWKDLFEVKIAGSHLPRHTNSRICSITHDIIKGAAYLLEDGSSVVSANDAIMWAKVYPFSPLGNLEKFMPF